MVRFNNLPADIYLEILQYLPPPDLGSFFCVNKYLYALTAVQRGKYQSLKRDFSTCLDTKQPGSTPRLIKSLLVDPQIALYVQHFTLNGCRSISDAPGQVKSDGRGHFTYRSSATEQLELAIRDLEYPSIPDILEWLRYCRVSEQAGLITLALTLFPNLTSIDLRYSGYFEDAERDNTFTQVCCFLREMILDSTKRKGNGGLFTRLVSITISASDGYSSSYFGLVQVFAALPSVKIINVHSIEAFEDPIKATVAMKGSNATDLNISKGCLSPARLMLILQSFERLQSFTYWPTSDPRLQYGFDPFSMVVTLLACAQHSLRELHIRAGSAVAKYMGSLRKFRVLESIETDVALLFPISVNRDDFLTSLPPSIQQIKLHGWKSNTCMGILFEGVRIFRNDFPSLRSIECFDVGDADNVEDDWLNKEEAYWQRRLARVNIAVKLVGHGHSPLPIYTRHRGHYAERQAKKALA